MSDCQDWKNVVIRGTNATTKPKVSTVQKTVFIGTGGVKVDPETEEVKIIKVDSEFSKQITKARTEKGKTQVQVAKELSIDVNVIKTFENGTATHNGAIVSKLKKYYNIHK